MSSSVVWSETELELLAKLAKSHTLPELAEALKRPPNQVRWAMRKRGIRTHNQHARTLAEVRRIIDDAKTLGRQAACEKHSLSIDAYKSLVRRFNSRAKNAVSNDPTELYRRALATAHRYDMAEHATDFAAWCTVQALEGGSMNGDLASRLIDYKRITWGETRSELGQAKIAATRGYAQLEDVTIRQTQPEFSHFKAILAQAGLKQSEHTILSLTYVYGFEPAEIGAIMGELPANVVGILNQALERVRSSL